MLSCLCRRFGRNAWARETRRESSSNAMEILKERFTCLTFDNRGIAESQPVGGPLTIELMAEDALTLMDHIGWDSAHIIGHSLGGLISLRLALTARARVRSLSLICAFARGAACRRVAASFV